MFALWAPVSTDVLSQPGTPLPSAQDPVSAPQGCHPCSGSAAAVLVFTPSLLHLLLPNFISCRVGPCWWTNLRAMAWPVLEQTQAWLSSSGEFADPYSSGQTVTDKVNNSMDHRFQQVINNNSVKNWRAVLKEGFLLGLISFNVFTNNLVNAIEGKVIKNLLRLPRGKDYILVRKQHYQWKGP